MPESRRVPAPSHAREGGAESADGAESSLPVRVERASRQSQSPPARSVWGRGVRRPVAGALGLLGGMLLLGLLPSLGESDETSSPAADDAGSPLADGEPGPLADIALPPPDGDVPRERPLQMVWALTPEIAADDRLEAYVAEEAAVVVEYMARHGIPGDGLAIEPGPPRAVRPGETALRQLAAAPAVREDDPVEVRDEARAALGSFVDDHVGIVVVTSEPGRWRRVVRPLSPPPAAGAGRGVESRGSLESTGASVKDTREAAHLVVLRPGADPVPADSPLRTAVPVDPEERGALAGALARAWVEAYGGRWTGQ